MIKSGLVFFQIHQLKRLKGSSSSNPMFGHSFSIESDSDFDDLESNRLHFTDSHALALDNSLFGPDFDEVGASARIDANLMNFSDPVPNLLISESSGSLLADIYPPSCSSDLDKTPTNNSYSSTSFNFNGSAFDRQTDQDDSGIPAGQHSPDGSSTSLSLPGDLDDFEGYLRASSPVADKQDVLGDISDDHWIMTKIVKFPDEIAPESRPMRLNIDRPHATRFLLKRVIMNSFHRFISWLLFFFFVGEYWGLLRDCNAAFLSKYICAVFQHIRILCWSVSRVVLMWSRQCLQVTDASFTNTDASFTNADNTDDGWRTPYSLMTSMGILFTSKSDHHSTDPIISKFGSPLMDLQYIPWRLGCRVQNRSFFWLYVLAVNCTPHHCSIWHNFLNDKVSTWFIGRFQQEIGSFWVDREFFLGKWFWIIGTNVIIYLPAETGNSVHQHDRRDTGNVM